MITCREFSELLFDFLEDLLPPEQRNPLERHLRDCPPCVAYFDSYRATILLSRQLPDAPLPPQLEQRLRAILRQRGDSAE